MDLVLRAERLGQPRFIKPAGWRANAPNNPGVSERLRRNRKL